MKQLSKKTEESKAVLVTQTNKEDAPKLEIDKQSINSTKNEIKVRVSEEPTDNLEIIISDDESKNTVPTTNACKVFKCWV